MAPLFDISDIEFFEASQYVSAVGLVILLWDHVLTFPDEVQLIWRARLSIAKVLFLFNRYVVPFAMIVQTHEFSGLTPYLSPSFCKAWYAVAVTVGMLSIATSNFLILLRLWVLWDRRPLLMLTTLTLFIVIHLLSLGLAAYVIYDMLPTLLFEPVLRICMPMSKPKFMLLWAPGTAFELMVFLTTVWNALDRPRSRDTRMSKILYRDGSMYFFGLFALRLLNILLCAFAPLPLTFLFVFLVWSVCNITLSRLILNLRRLSNQVDDKSEDAKVREEAGKEDGELEDDIDINEVKTGVDEIELPVLTRGECGIASEWTL